MCFPQPKSNAPSRSHCPESVEGRLSDFSRLTFAAIALLAPPTHAQSLPWDYQPYRVRAVIALELPGGIADHMNAELPTYLQRRVTASIGPLWSFDVEIATGAMRQRVLSQSSKPSPSGRGQGEGAHKHAPSEIETENKPPADIPWADVDKLALIAVSWSPDGYLLTAREYDTLVQRWGTPIRRQACQLEALPEQAFAILWQTVSPIAQFELIADDEKHVVLKPRGAELIRPGSPEPWSKPGDVFLPILRRTSRGGQLVENGIAPVPWTFVEVVANEDQEQQPSRALIHSGTRRPFGIRRQGRVEQIAIALRSDPADTVLRLRSRVAKDKPLVGYEVFAQADPNKPDALERLGATDLNGLLEVPPAKERVRNLVIKHGGHLLARLPVVPGAQPVVDIPLPDDDAHVAAEARLAALREDLIDVVARRNILIARVRQRIKKKDFEGAQKLLLEINELPGKSQFNLEITNAARRMRSDDPRIQRRIDHLFEGTQAALTQYLDTRPINELTNELRDAQQKNGG